MRSSNQNKLLWVSLLACAFAKNVALAAPTTAVKDADKPVARMLSWSELTESGLFKEVEIEKTSEGFRLTGSYPTACAADRGVQMVGDATNNRFGVRVASEGVVDCLKKNKNSSSRSYLSELGVFLAKDGEVRYYWEDTQQDVVSSKRFQSQLVDADFKSAMTLMIEQNMEAQGQKAERVTAILADIEAGCAGSPEEIERAKEGLSELSTMNLVTAREFKNLSQALSNASGMAELQTFHDRVAEADYSELKVVRRDLKRLTRQKQFRKNPDAQDEAAIVFAEIVARYREQKREEPKKALQACGLIRDTVREAQSISRLSIEARADLKNIQNETEIDCMTDIAKYGRARNPMFEPNWQQLMARLGQEKDYACNVTANPMMDDGLGGLDLSVCSKAIESYQYAEVLPKYADDADKRRQEQIDALNKARTAAPAPAGSGSVALAGYGSLTGFNTYGTNTSTFR